MRRPDLLGASWPDELELELVRAALGPPAQSARSWRSVLAAIALDDVWDHEMLALMPLVWRQLADEGSDHPELPRLKGIYRKSWLAEQQARLTLDEATELLTAAGVDVTLAPGSLPSTLASSPGLIVAPAAATEAIRALTHHGWSVGTQRPGQAPWRHRFRVDKPGGAAMVLQASGGRWLIDERDPHASWDWLAGRRPNRSGDPSAVPAMAPADELVAICTDGPTPASPMRLRWVVTALDLLGREVVVDEVVEVSERFDLVPLVHSAARFLRDQLAVQPADELVQALTPRIASARHRRGLDRAMSTTGEGRRGGRIRADWARTRRQWSTPRAARELPGFAVDRWSLGSATELPRAMITRARRHQAPVPGTVAP